MFQRILDVVINEPNLERLIELTNAQLRRETESARAALAAATERLSDVRRRLGHLYEAIESGQVDLADLGPRIRELRETERQQLSGMEGATHTADNSRSMLLNRRQLQVYLQDLRALLSAGTPVQWREFLRSFVQRIGISGEAVEIEYTLPLPSGRTGISREGVLPTTLNGGP